MLTKEQNRIIFNIARKVFEQEMSKQEGLDSLLNIIEMNRGSAQMIMFQVIPNLIKGEKFTRTLGVAEFDDYLSFIQEDYGVKQLGKSLSALKQHIDYIKEKGDPKIKLKKVYQRYLNIIVTDENALGEDDFEQNEIVDFFNTKSRHELIEELRSLDDIEDEKIVVNHKSYKRNNKVIALIKILRNFECQICGLSIKKKDGARYVEAAHIIPKRKKGKETPENIILLCPNHHKEFDLGDCEIIKHNQDEVQFKLNDSSYKLSLSI
jgi:hypothetical protein